MNYIQVETQRLETAYIGNGDLSAPTIVLLHEGLGCVGLWKSFPAELHKATGKNVFLYSRAGYGGSDQVDLPRPHTYMHDEALNVLPKVLEVTGLVNVALLGHSDGGSIALINAGGMDDPKIKGIITIAAHVFNEEISVKGVTDAKAAFENGKLRASLEKFHGKNVDNAFWGWSDTWLNPDFMQWNLEALLPAINVPVLAMQGRQDPYGSDKQLSAICDGIGESAVCKFIADCGHAPHVEKPAVVMDAVTSFISDLWH